LSSQRVVNMEHLFPEMVRVSCGEFLMGSPSHEIGRLENEGPPHTVTIRRPFEVGAFPVTVAQFAMFANATAHPSEGICRLWQGNSWQSSTGSFRSPGFQQSGCHPAVCVNWEDARAYTSWLSAEIGQAYRLPTEAEWEFCARAGTTTRYWWGDNFVSAQVNCRSEKSATPLGSTVAINKYRPNPWGICQVNGNVWEWVEDRYAPNYRNAPDDSAAHQSASSELRVLRGGSWNNGPNGVRSARRHAGKPDLRRSDIGFRVAKTLFV
jgi:formylglycine-generating enzyme required for sulfatase activity